MDHAQILPKIGWPTKSIIKKVPNELYEILC